MLLILIHTTLTFLKILQHTIVESNPIYNIHDPLGIPLLTRFRLGLTHLKEHWFNHNFDNCINPSCTYSLKTESTTHFFLYCHFYSNICKTLLDNLNVIFKHQYFTFFWNCLDWFTSIWKIKFWQDLEKILTASVKNIVDSERFTGPIF